MNDTTETATIYALSSGHGRAGVAVVRISGPTAAAVLAAMAAPCPAPRRAALRLIRHPATGEVLDQALVLLFRGPASETGEDIAELHLHGSPAVVRAVLAALSECPGCRLAEPGEFARRAFLNGKIDLTGAEGLADLIDAETDAQRRQALRQAGGSLARLYDGWRDTILEARAFAEAAIDFADEADVAADALDRARASATELDARLAVHLSGAARGEIVRDGFRVTLAGPPNAGKSSLLNALARRDVAIVSSEPGTTRDVLEVRLDLGGYPVVVADTAGLREAESAIEREGVRRSLARVRDADLVLWLVDAEAPVWSPPPDVSDGAAEVMIVLNKTDLVAPDPMHPLAARISARTGAGIADLESALADAVTSRLSDATPDTAIPTQARHREALTRCRAALVRALAPTCTEPELIAEELRHAADELGRLTGRVDPEELLGLIFGRFCIGK